MRKSILEKVKTVPKFWWLLLAILAVGAFLRSYNHHDWLRFNADQGRDSQIVSGVVDGTAAWPLLGPKAGGTQFRLGAVFYYFEIVSAKIFGNTPDKMAYPDLFSGILCIPLLFFFLRKYFDKYISLAMTAIFAVSSYAIFYSRFAWNPNSIPFWTILFLYAIFEIFSKKSKSKYLWSVVAAVAMGVGVQLHTTLLVILPIFTVIVFGYFSFKNRKMLKYFFVIFVLSLLINTPQLINEYHTNGKNVQAFFGGVNIKNKAESSLFSNTIQGTSCWIQTNVDIISGYEISDTCSFVPSKSSADTLVFLSGAVFVIGGTILAIRYFLRETDTDHKLFLGIIFVFTGISFLLFLKIAYELSVRFYLPLIFLPFLMLGFWIRFFREKFGFRYAYILLIASVPLIFSNLFFVQKSFAALANYGNAGGSSSSVTILKEAEAFGQFVADNSGSSKEVYIDGDKEFLHKSYRSLKYIAGRSKVNLRLVSKKYPAPAQYFYVASLSRRDKMLKDGSIKIIRDKTYGSFAILLVQNI